MKKILITGASGFIGKALCKEFARTCSVTGVYDKNRPSDLPAVHLEQVNITDTRSVFHLCRQVAPDVVIHCAAIAHQHIGAVDKAAYFSVNSESTEILAGAAYGSNPSVTFIFLSSVSVYGENNLQTPVSESHACRPTSDYGLSKLDAEQRLTVLAGNPEHNRPFILRLAPVYDRAWSVNLDRRVLAPFNAAYVKFGSGRQQMSALSRPNLVDFVKFLITEKIEMPPADCIFNVCDAESYAFGRIIHVYRQSALKPSRPVLSVPLPIVFIFSRLAGRLYSSKKEWFHAGYEKLASSLIFDNDRMLRTGFKPGHSLETIYPPSKRG
jgi:nucleoside-diphosphate-sugar epimerase